MFTISLSVFIYNHELFVFLPLSSCSGLQSVKGRGRIPAHVAQGTDVHRHVTTLRAPAPRSVERGRKRESDGRRACRLLRTRPWVVSPSLNHITDISRYTVRIDVLQMFFRQVLFYFFIMFHTVFFFPLQSAVRLCGSASSTKEHNSRTWPVYWRSLDR